MNPKVREAIQAVIDRCFFMNALCDRMVYVMQGHWFMKAFAKHLHEQVAHAYPSLADQLSEVLLGEGENVTRGAIEAQTQDYMSPTQLLETYQDEVLATRRIFGDAYYAAIDNREVGIASLLEDILEDFQEGLVAQAIHMAGKATQYGDNTAQIDSDAGVFF